MTTITIPSKLTDVTGNIRATIVIGDNSSAVQFWDVGYKGSPEEPLLLAEQGWEQIKRGMSKGLIPEHEFLKNLLPSYTAEEAEESSFADAVNELLSAMSEISDQLAQI